jgi:hypothetical protein
VKTLKTLWFPFAGTLAAAVLLLLFAGRSEVNAQPGIAGSAVYAPGQYLPTSLGNPTTTIGNLTFNFSLTALVLANQDTVTHVVTVQDGTGVALFPALTMAAVGSANSTWVAPLGNIRFISGLQWSTDASSKVRGWIVGMR